MPDHDDQLCTTLRDALRTARTAADARFLDHARWLIRALCSTIELRARLLHLARTRPAFAHRATAIITAADADALSWRADACDLLDDADEP